MLGLQPNLSIYDMYGIDYRPYKLRLMSAWCPKEKKIILINRKVLKEVNYYCAWKIVAGEFRQTRRTQRADSHPRFDSETIFRIAGLYLTSWRRERTAAAAEMIHRQSSFCQYTLSIVMVYRQNHVNNSVIFKLLLVPYCIDAFMYRLSQCTTITGACRR